MNYRYTLDIGINPSQVPGFTGVAVPGRRPLEPAHISAATQVTRSELSVPRGAGWSPTPIPYDGAEAIIRDQIHRTDLVPRTYRLFQVFNNVCHGCHMVNHTHEITSMHALGERRAEDNDEQSKM